MIISYNQLQNIRQENSNKRIALFKGTFDLFHYAHLKLLERIKAENDLLIVEIKSDNDVRKKGKNRPIMQEFERASIVDNIKFTDYTIIASKRKKTEAIDSLIKEKTYSDKEIYKLLRDGYLIEKLHPDGIYTTNEKPVPQVIIDFCKKLNININVIPMQGGQHTTDIINKCKQII